MKPGRGYHRVALSDAIPGSPQGRRRHGSSALQGQLPHTSRSDWLDNDRPREACGVVGVYAPGDDVANVAYFGLFALQHRGQESAGIATADGQDMLLDNAATPWKSAKFVSLRTCSRGFHPSLLQSLTERSQGCTATLWLQSHRLCAGGQGGADAHCVLRYEAVHGRCSTRLRQD